MRGRGRERSDRIEEQAVQRLIAILEHPSQAAEAELAEWIGRDPAHGVAFARAEAAWEASALLARGREQGACVPPDDQARTSATRAQVGRAALEGELGGDNGRHATFKGIARGTG